MRTILIAGAGQSGLQLALGHATKWTNALLGPPPEHVLNLIGAAGQLPAAARRFVNGFDDPV